ncbi:MAG: ATP-binding cassette domain-containing protein, partial [Polyangiales bacterium]
SHFQQPVGSLSGGEQNRLLLARLLLAEPNLMLLDEPSNHLDIEATEWLEDFLLESSAAMIVVSHDRYFLDRVATKILAFEGDGRVIAYAGNYSDYRDQRAARQAESRRNADRSPQKPKGGSSAKGQKLSYKEKQELHKLVAGIERVETQAAEVEALLNDPALYAERAEEVPAIVARQGVLQAELDRMMTRWMELESKAARE